MEKYIYDLLMTSGDLQLQEIVLRIIIATIMGGIIFISYRLTHSGLSYSHKFNITLVTLAIMTTMVILVIGNNIALSLGMLGALSIIRFKTSIKDSRDIIYIFWAIVTGVCSGVGNFLIPGIGSCVIFIVLLLFGQVREESNVLIVIRGRRLLEQDIRSVVFDYFVKAPSLKVMNSTDTSVELIYELHKNNLSKSQKVEENKALKENRTHETVFEKLYKLEGIEYANLIVQNDDMC